MLDLSVTVIILNILVNLFNLIKNSLGPLLREKYYIMIVFYIFGRLFVSFSTSDSTDYFKAQKLSISSKKFTGPFEHTFLYTKVYKQIQLMRNWLRNIVAIFFISKSII